MTSYLETPRQQQQHKSQPLLTYFVEFCSVGHNKQTSLNAAKISSSRKY